MSGNAWHGVVDGSEPLDLLAELRVYIARHYKTQTNFAAALGVSSAFVCGVVSGRKAPTDQILDAIGIERVVTYKFKGTP